MSHGSSPPSLAPGSPQPGSIHCSLPTLQRASGVGGISLTQTPGVFHWYSNPGHAVVHPGNVATSSQSCPHTHIPIAQNLLSFPSWLDLCLLPEIISLRHHAFLIWHTDHHIQIINRNMNEVSPVCSLGWGGGRGARDRGSGWIYPYTPSSRP